MLLCVKLITRYHCKESGPQGYHHLVAAQGSSSSFENILRHQHRSKFIRKFKNVFSSFKTQYFIVFQKLIFRISFRCKVFRSPGILMRSKSTLGGTRSVENLALKRGALAEISGQIIDLPKPHESSAVPQWPPPPQNWKSKKPATDKHQEPYNSNTHGDDSWAEYFDQR